ncbi:MAG: class I SAM-dependent methyltransferase [Casimicrobiaceae bacterium]
MSDLAFTGERFLPGCAGEIAYEHWHRYAFARRFVAGKRVLDAACGEGYGTALLGAHAASAVGVDIDAPTVAHATARYGDGARIRFVEGSCAQLPLPDASVDVVVSFETVEHLVETDQPRMIAEFARVLAPDGIVVISSPNKSLYSEARGYVNEFHQHELYREEFGRLLGATFPAMSWHHQRVATWSGIWAERPGAQVGVAEAWLGSADGVAPYEVDDGMYFVVIAGRSTAALPASPGVSLLADVDDSEGARALHNEREMLRLDTLLKEANAGLDRQSAHILHLERLVAERDAGIVDRDRRLADAARDVEKSQREIIKRAHAIAALEVEIGRLNLVVTQRDREVSDRQSLRWWFRLPWLRLQSWLGRKG